MMSSLSLLLSLMLMAQPSWASSAYLALEKDAFTERTEPPASSPVRTRPITNNVFKLPVTSMIVTTTQNVIGGAPSSANEFPYNVLFTSETGVCSGVLIHPDIVLTTVSCMAAQTSDARIGGVSSDGMGPTVRTVAERLQHPNFNAATLENDLLIIKLSETTDITPVELAITVPASTSPVTAIGFGLTSEDGTAASALQNVEISVLDFANCENFLNAAVFSSSQICAGNLADGRGHCEQDEGGALLSGSTLVGLFSFNEACGEVDEPSVYTSVPAYLEFIEAAICDISSVPPAECESAAPSISPAPSVSPAPSLQPTSTTRPSSETMPSVVPSTLLPSEPSKKRSKKSKKEKKGGKGKGKGSSSESGKGKGKGKGSSSESGKGIGKGKGSSSESGKGKGSSSESGKGKKGMGKKGMGKGKKGKGSSYSSDIAVTQGRNVDHGAVPLYKLTRQQRRRRRRRRRFGK